MTTQTLYLDGEIKNLAQSQNQALSGSTGLLMTQYEITLMIVEGRLGGNARGDWKIRSEIIKMMRQEMLKVAWTLSVENR